MAHWGKVLATKSEELNLIPGVSWKNREPNYDSCLMTSTWVFWWHMYTQHTHTDTHIPNTHKHAHAQ